MKIALFSDTHALHGQINIPDADILIFAGDMTHCRTAQDVSDFNSFLGGLPHKHKIVVGGNHDHRLARDPEKAKYLFTEAAYLLDDSGASEVGTGTEGTVYHRLQDGHLAAHSVGEYLVHQIVLRSGNNKKTPIVAFVAIRVWLFKLF